MAKRLSTCIFPVRRNICTWLLCFLAVSMTVLCTFHAVRAENTANTGSQKAALENAGSNFQPLEPEKPKTERTPSSTVMGETTEILIHFMILWSVIYLIIKFVRMWLDKHK